MAEKMRVLISTIYPPGVVEYLKRECGDKCVFYEHKKTSPMPRKLFLRTLRDFKPHAIFCTLNDKINKEAVDAAGPQLRVVSTMSVGFDHIDFPLCKSRGILVGNTPGVLTETTADLSLALMLSTLRRIPESISDIRKGKWGAWEPMGWAGIDLHHATVGIVGLGRIGFAIGKRLKGFDCKILYYDVVPVKEAAVFGGEFCPKLDDLLARSDIVTVHCPATPETCKLFNKATFAKMKKGSVFINVARGACVDHKALYQALKSGHLAMAGLDVTDPEPISLRDPLLSLPNCVVVPHIGSASIATRTKMGMLAADNIIAGLGVKKIKANIMNPPRAAL